MAAIPARSLVFTGFGDAATRFTSPAGVELTGPSGLWPGQAGTYFQGVVQLSSGLYGCCSESGAPAYETFQVFDRNWTYVGGWGAVPGPGGYATRGMCGVNEVGWFVLTVNGGNVDIRHFDASGAQVASHRVANAPETVAFPSIGVNAAGTIAYWGRQHATNGTGIRRWNLSSGSALSDLVAQEGDGPCNLNGILVLADDTIVVGWKNGGLKRYDTSGALLNTYTVPTVGASAFYVLARGADAASFWVSTYEDDGDMGVYRFRTADGAQLNYFAKALGGFEWDGPFGVVLVGTNASTIPLDTSTPCCCSDGGSGGGGGTGATGPILPPTSTDWTPRCDGGGTVPTAADLTDSEDWSA